MRNAHQHVVARVELLQFADAALRLVVVVGEALGDVVEGLRPARLGVDVLDEERAGTAGAELRPRRRLHVRGEGDVFGWSELAPVMTGVAAHEEEGVCGCARQPAHVPDGVSWAVQEVEAPVAEVVERWEAAEREGEIRFGDLADGTALEV